LTEKVYGLHAVRALLMRHAGRVASVTIAEGREPRVTEIQALAQKSGKPVKRASAAAFKQLFGDAVHQGVYADVEPMPSWREEDLVEAIARALGAGGDKPFVLVLDGVQDPHNLGACLRTADACGALAVVIPRDRAVQMNATVRKVAAGAAESTPLAVVTNLARTLRLLKEAGLWIVGADAEAPKLAHETDLTGPVAVVMGAEGAGLRQLTRETCDYLVRLPQAGTVESLNVSVATGMLLYEALRQRRTRGQAPGKMEQRRNPVA
jgi:23S rRNA (guanosine2251-2'-O)-methyltransferase